MQDLITSLAIPIGTLEETVKHGILQIQVQNIFLSPTLTLIKKVELNQWTGKKLIYVTQENVISAIKLLYFR